jgi:C1A family cysteine protease
MSKEVLGRHWEELKRYPNVLNVAVATKWKDGLDTGVPSITIYVSKKVSETQLVQYEIIPKEIEQVPTDVIEVAPTSWNAGTTSVSDQHPEQQLRRLGLSEKPLPKARLRTLLTTKAPSGESELTKWLSEIQDQINCGSCPSFGNIGVWEGCIRIKENNPSDPIKLSEAHLFFCSGGTCDGGNTVEATLNQAMQGVCLESCLPYKDQDQACGTGICKDWWLNAKKLAGWNAVNEPIEIKVLLDTIPLNGTMSVHQSFFNYVSGVYKNLGAQDPIVGGHDIGVVGYSDKLNAHLIRNSWKGWGAGCIVNGVNRPGYCWIDYGELDQQMQQLLLSDDPVPAPNPPPPTPGKRCILGLPSWLNRKKKLEVA